MHAVADTDRLVADGIITQAQAAVIESRARETMVALAINKLLSGGIIAATGGVVLWLQDALAVALTGTLALAAGIAILARGGALYRIFGNAAALIGAGMLIGGSTLKLLTDAPDIAGQTIIVAGGLTALAAALALRRVGPASRFVTGAILLLGIALHLGGIGFYTATHGTGGLAISLLSLYSAALIGLAGWFIDLRLVTALAIVPFAQALDTSTEYFHAAYVFYSPEPTLSILQMALLMGLCYWLTHRFAVRTARHGGILAVMAFIVANLCALVGSLWGDMVGRTLWAPSFTDTTTSDAYDAAMKAFANSTLTISANVYAVLWAVALAAMVLCAGANNRRGLFNTALTFAAIHAYTQVFETFYAEPLAYVIGGLAAIPLAWGMWRLNTWFLAKGRAASPVKG